MTAQPESSSPATPIKPEAQFLEVIRENDVQGAELITLQGAFAPMFAEAEKWATIVASIRITDVSQVREMKLARETRLALRAVRVNAEKKRKALNEGALRYTRAVNGAAAIINYITEPLEEKLLEQEKFAERQEQARIEKLKLEREDKLKTYGVDVTLYQLGPMPQEAFDSLLEGSRLAYEARETERKRVEQERLETENRRLIEEKRVRDENARLLKEKAERDEADRLEKERVAAELARREQEIKDLAEKRTELLKPYGGYGVFVGLGLVTEEAFQENLATAKRHYEEALRRQAEADKARQDNEQALAEERRKSDELLAAQQAESARIAEQARKDKEAADARAAADKTAREKAEKELQATKDAEAKRVADEEAARKRAAGASDKEKIEAFRVALANVILPPMTTPEAKTAAALIVIQQGKFNVWLTDKINSL